MSDFNSGMNGKKTVSAQSCQIPVDSVELDQPVASVSLLTSDHVDRRDNENELSETEKRLFENVAQNSFEDIKKFLKENGKLDFNKRNYESLSILQVAVKRGDVRIVQLLIDAGCEDPRALDLAGALGSKDILHVLTAKSTRGKSQEEISKSIETKEERSDQRRRLKAAIDADDCKTVKELVEKMGDDPKALRLQCLCPDCRDKSPDYEGEDELEEAHIHLEVCRILSSPTYILARDCDPIHEALCLTTHLKSMAYWHSENKNEFTQMAERCSKLAVDLLAECTSHEEAKLLFKDVKKGKVIPDKIKYKRLHDAVGLMQKEFVAHPTCQLVIWKLWLGSCYVPWRKWSGNRRLLHVLCQILLVPTIFVLFVFKVKFARNCLKSPMNRFIYAATCYCFFLAVVVANQHLARPKNWPTPAIDGYDLVIGVWVFGHICKIVHEFTAQRHFSYYRLWWGIYETVMVTFFIAGAVTFVVGFGHRTGEVANWKILLLSQGLYSIAMTLAYIRTLQWLHLHSTMGPLAISFNRMTVVMGRLLVIFGVLFLSFSVGIYTVYKNFNSVLPTDKRDDSFFSSYPKTLKILFWAILGKGEGNYASIPESYRFAPGKVNVTAEIQDSFTVFVGQTLWSFFHVAVVVVLLNMLIALMTYYYQFTQDNSDIEWKFARTKLRTYYIEKYTRFPPPINLIAYVGQISKYVFNKCTGSPAHDEVDIKKDTQKASQDEYQDLLNKLTVRYRHTRHLAKSREERHSVLQFLNAAS